MSEEQDGGSAFPFEIGRYNNCGMSLRDYFAAKALQGWLSTYGEDCTSPHLKKQSEDVASVAYAIADAMLAERAKGPQP